MKPHSLMLPCARAQQWMVSLWLGPTQTSPDLVFQCRRTLSPEHNDSVCLGTSQAIGPSGPLWCLFRPKKPWRVPLSRGSKEVRYQGGLAFGLIKKIHKSLANLAVMATLRTLRNL